MVCHGRFDMLPLEGITVIALEHAVAAPFATRQLADQGARVIKIERPGVGDFARGYDARVNGLASYFVWTNRSKESLTLDVKHPEAATILRKLLAHSDVLVQNLAPGSAERLGLSFDALHADFPRLITCSISGYGSDGPDRDRKAYDLLIQAEAGLLSVTGTTETPSKAGMSIADISAGMYAYTNILTALIKRGKTGTGSAIDVSMLESMAEWMGFPLYYAIDGQQPPQRCGASHATIYPYGPFPVKDGHEILLGIQNEREWDTFCAIVLEQPGLAEDARFKGNSRRTQNKADLKRLIDTIFSKLSVDQVLDRLNRAGIANARMNDMQGVWQHRQLKARDRWRQVGTPAGEIPALLPPGGLNGSQARMDPVPDLGEHSHAILTELGYDDAHIAALAKEGAI